MLQRWQLALRNKMSDFPNVSFVEQAFEAWQPSGEFDLIISAKVNL